MAEDGQGPLTRLRELADRNEGTSKLADAIQDYASAKASQLVTGAVDKVGSYAEDLVGGGLKDVAGPLAAGAGKLAEGKGGVAAAAAAGGKGLKDKVTGSLGKLVGGSGSGSGGAGGGTKAVNIIEDIDVGVPVRVAYDQWTRFADFADFTKGARSVKKTDESTSDWEAKVFWSTRNWKATITEQVPDRRIAWSSEGSKATTEGAVTFHPLGENLTRVLVVVQYHPRGAFEHVGNIWRAQGRRLRLDLKRYRSRLMNMAEAEAHDLEGWRGEIREGEVVLSHEDAMAFEDSELSREEWAELEGLDADELADLSAAAEDDEDDEEPVGEPDDEEPLEEDEAEYDEDEEGEEDYDDEEGDEYDEEELSEPRER